MGQVSIGINGRRYGIVCDDGEEERITELGQVLATRVRQLTEAVGQVGDARLLVMAGLLLTDELMQSQLVSHPDRAGVAATSASGRIRDSLVGRIEALACEAEQVAERVEQT